MIHDIGLGTTQLPYARHGMYLKARDILVEGNTIYNCFYGQGISLRNAGIIRNNKIWNCLAGLCIAYWAQTNTSGSSKTVVIEGNQCRQDYSMVTQMRHIYDLAKKPGSDRSSAMIQVAFVQKDPCARIEKFVIRGNTCIAYKDYDSQDALIQWFGKQQPWQTIILENNTFVDMRKNKQHISNLAIVK